MNKIIEQDSIVDFKIVMETKNTGWSSKQYASKQFFPRPVSPNFTLIWYHIVFSRLLDRQDEEMDYLNLFIDYHYKSIVSIIWARHILTLHLSHANWRKLKLSHYWQLQERSCTLCNFYQIESYHTFSSCNPLSMEDEETLILLYH